MATSERPALRTPELADDPPLEKGGERRRRQRGSTDDRPTRVDVRRFLSKLEVQASGCWTWTGHVSHFGHGIFWWRGRNNRAHRFAYELFVGPVPEGLTLDHLCRVPGCVNPTHVEAVTQGVNTLRGENATAWNARKTHCKHDHEFTTENTRRTKNGGRECKECKRTECRERSRRKRAEARASLA